MTYPPTPGNWQDPAGTADPVGPQPTYVDPISGQPATVGQDPTRPYPAAPAQPGYPANYPAYGTPDPTYGASGYPGYQSQPGYQGYQQPAYPQASYPTSYSGYTGYTTPVMPVGQKTNGLAIASLVVSLAGLPMVFCYGAGGLIGLVGAILGHVAQRQVRERGEGGRGLAMAGTIVGWVTLALGIVIGALHNWFVVRTVNQMPATTY